MGLTAGAGCGYNYICLVTEVEDVEMGVNKGQQGLKGSSITRVKV